jgi:hypothetical protein
VDFGYYFQNDHHGNWRNAGYGFVVTFSEVHSENTTIELCFGWALGFTPP